MITRHDIAAALGEIPLAIKSATISRDEEWSPYVQADLTITTPSAEVVALLDPRGAQIVVDLVVTEAWKGYLPVSSLSRYFRGQPVSAVSALGPISNISEKLTLQWNTPESTLPDVARALHLWLRSRPRDLGNGEMTLTLVSGEMLLQDYAPVSAMEYDPGTNYVRPIVEQVLARLGFTLEPIDDPDTSSVAVDAVLWLPGVSAWDYLEPLLQVANRRLYCDELGRWWLEDRRTVKPGNASLTLGVDAITAAADDIDRDEWADAVVVTYSWRDEDGNDRRDYDIAQASPTPSRVAHFEYDTARPGSGAAKRLLRRTRTKGRGFEATIVSDYTIDPGMTATVITDGGEPLAGYITRTVWNLPDDETNLSTRGVVEASTTAWSYFPTGLSWSEIPTGLAWGEAAQLLEEI